MDRLVSMLTGAHLTRSKNDDDISDRLSSRYTVVLLILFAILVSMTQYVRNPITCWAPKHFTGSHTQYTTNYCWVKDTYYLPWTEEVLTNEGSQVANRQQVPYYQWIPFILICQAILFYIPHLIWHGLNTKCGVDADNILETAHRLGKSDTNESHQKTLRIVTKQLDRFLSTRKHPEARPKGWKCCISFFMCKFYGRRMGSYLVILFLFSKCAYLVNIIMQLIALNYVLNVSYHTFGLDMLTHFGFQRDWTEDEQVAFPRVTLCDFLIRGQDLANAQNHTVQCVLPINMYNEKIYVFLWFWMILVACFSIVSLFTWLARIILLNDRVKFVKNRIGCKMPTPKDENLAKNFVKDYLGQDGCLIIRLIAHNTNHVTTSEIICDLWEFWKEINVNTLSNVSTPSTSTGGCNIMYPEIELDNIDSNLPLCRG